jgi:sialate O-acetylesterase
MTINDVGDNWMQLRAYVIPSDILIPGQENVLAVRVEDVYMHGGIYDGPIGLVTRDKYLRWKKQRDEWWNLFDWFSN